MKIDILGGEFSLIKKMVKGFSQKKAVVGIGDDAAVIRVGKKLLCISTDTMVEGTHFSFNYFTPLQVGKKAIESNVSDIAAMGGIPHYITVALTVKKNTDVNNVEELYHGIKQCCQRYSLSLIGGDTTVGPCLSITVTIIGEVTSKNLCKRSDAQPGDFIMVSGDVGKSEAGLQLLKKGLTGKAIHFHLEPCARLDFSKKYSSFINAMEDVSDGLASEIRNMCEQSHVGAIIFKENLPLSHATIEAAHRLHQHPYDYALFGGEDYELVFTVSEKNLSKVPGFLVGEITKRKGIRLFEKGKEMPLLHFGYDHFIK